MESYVGVPRNNSRLDLSDGELKMYGVNASGKAKDTVAVTDFSGSVDDYLLEEPPGFYDAAPGEKLRRTVFGGYVRPDPKDWRTWFVRQVALVGRTETPALYDLLERDFGDLCRNMTEVVRSGKMIRTMHGRNYLLQVRRKGSAKDRPIVSRLYRRNVSDLGKAFYLSPRFVNTIFGLPTRGRYKPELQIPPLSAGQVARYVG